MGSGGGVFRGEPLRMGARLAPSQRMQLLGQADEVAHRLSNPWRRERIARSHAALR
jgi:hypothetical protein